jgi:site-specific DNA-methyltransferase (adenine-specific)
MKIEFEHFEIKGQTLVLADSIEFMKSVPDDSFDCVITSPPYNIGVDYNQYNDTLPLPEYLDWTTEWIKEVARLLKDDGSFFLNINGSLSHPLIPHQVLLLTSEHFVLQNEIIWVKSIFVPEALHINTVKNQTTYEPGHSFGHFKPVNSDRYLNNTHEYIFHFTLKGNLPIEKLAVGVPYMHPSNLTRWKTKKMSRCGGNCWYIPYETKNAKSSHPAMFPIALAEKCLKLHFGSRKGGSTLDPFAGSGTTALACVNLGLNSVCIEVDSDYYNHSISILKEHFNAKKVRTSIYGDVA